MHCQDFLKGLMAAAILFSVQIAHADDAPEQQLATLLNTLQTTQGSFEQVVSSQQGMTLQTTSGTFALHRPGLFRWQTLKPSPQLLVADGSKIWLYDHELNQVAWFKEEVNNSQSPAMLLVGQVQDLTKLYRITLKNSDDQAVFTLKPRKNSFFEQVQVIFDDAALRAMVIKDHMGQTIRIDFSQLSDGANGSLFHFSPPKGVDLVQAAV